MKIPLRCVCAVVVCLVALTRPLLATPHDDLLAAAGRDDALAAANALAAGADPDARDRTGTTALMHAVTAESFTVARELLWAGADARTRNRAGRTAAELLPAMNDANRPLHLLVRAHTYLQANATRARTRPAKANLVLIMEDTVNYLHPQLKSAYVVSQAEASGTPGRDDDNDGFVDNVFGWNAVVNRPYQIREATLNAYLRHRDAIGRILKIDADRATGAISDDAAGTVLAEFTNPLSEIMGPMPGLSDGEFLEMVKQAAHGSHVAGIVLEASEGRALLHTLAVDFHEESRRSLGPDTDAIVQKLIAESPDPETVLREYRARLLTHMTQRSRVASRYLQSTGAGVVNLSFGGGMEWWKGHASGLALRSVFHLQSLDESYEVDFDRIGEMAAHWGFEMYIANALEVALMAFENPDVLFVCAAGNEDSNNDQTLINPAYLSRFFPNVITVASVGRGDHISDFSNFGVLSVNVSAPGEDILSTVIPEASMYLDGTSMATPHVAGVAALIRTVAPDLTAAELRAQLEYTARATTQLALFTSSGGVVDKNTLRALHTGNARPKSDAFARMAINTAQLDAALYPRHQADADRYSQRAIELDPGNPEAWRARAAFFDIIGQPERAWEFIEKAAQLGPRDIMVWISRALIQENRGDLPGAIESISRVIALYEAAGAGYENQRARRLVSRAVWYERLGQTELARADVRLARQLNERVQVPENLQGLL